MQSTTRLTFAIFAILGFAYLSQAHPLRSSAETEIETKSTELAVAGSSEVATTPATTEIDTLGESTRVKRQGGCGCCGCGCGCCCCRPRCCCCCRRCCTCCRTCCCTRCCTCCRPCCCGCGCGCGCCGCGGGGRKRRQALQTLKVKLAEKVKREAELIPETPVEVAENLEVIDNQKPEPETETETATEWPAPVYELVTETWAH